MLNINLLLDLDRRRRELQAESDAIQAQLNSLSREIGSMMKEGRKEEAEAAKKGISTMKEKQKQLAEILDQVSDEMQKELISCLLYTSDAADDLLCVDLGGRRII